MLLDLTMPGMTGEAVLRELLAIRPSVRVLLSRGFNEVEAVRHFMGKGLAGYSEAVFGAYPGGEGKGDYRRVTFHRRPYIRLSTHSSRAFRQS